MGRAFERLFGPGTGGNLINQIFKRSNTTGGKVLRCPGDVEVSN